MKALRSRLEAERVRLGVRWDVLERDYAISWILAGMSEISSLRELLVFKGGTALKKCYFGDYRFSEDLDFSTTGEMPASEELEAAMQEACRQAGRLAQPYAHVEVTCARYTESEPHPRGQEAFTLMVKLPWHREPRTTVMVEITADEPFLKPVQNRPILHGYGEELTASIQVYSLEEVMGEKLRAILQHSQRMQQRGWTRSRARDFYDLWRILCEYRDHLELNEFTAFVRQKCDVRGVSFIDGSSFFPVAMLSFVEQTWQQWLGPLVPELPFFDTVIGELQPQIQEILRDNQAP